MSASEFASLVISGAALVAVVASNVFYARQAREMRAQTRSVTGDLAVAADESIKAWYIEIGRIFIEHPELRPVFYADERNGPLAELSTANRLRAATVAEHFLDSFEEEAKLANDPSVPFTNTYLAYFHYIVQGSDFLYDFLCRHSDWYPDLLTVAHEARQKRDS